MREVEQALDNIPDLKLLAAGLEEMGFRVRLIANTISFSGVDKTTGMYQSGSYANGKLVTEEGLDLEMLKKYTAKANIIAQVAKQQNDKYKATKLSIKWTGEFDFVITKK